MMKKSEVNALAKCPKCNAVIYNDCCVGCGYMTNGNYIKVNSSATKFKDLRTYNNSFEEMTRNEKKFITFILGSFYFSYRNHFLIGILISTFDVLFSCFIIEWFMDFFAPSDLLMLYFVYVYILLYIIIKKLLYMTFANMVCLKLDELRLKHLKIKHKNYEEIISSHDDKSVFKLLLNLIFCFVVLFAIILFT